MATRAEQPAIIAMDDLYSLARQNKGFEKIEQGIINHPEWLTKIPDGRKWAIIHQIVYHGKVEELNRLLVLQTQNPDFLLLSKTADNKTVLDIAREQMAKNGAMFKRVERLAMMDDLLNNAKAKNWKACRSILDKTPEIINEKPPYRRYYCIHHIALVGDQKVFDEFHHPYKFDLNLLTNEDKSIVDIANLAGHKAFAKHVQSLIEASQTRETSDQFSRESRMEERAKVRDSIAGSITTEPAVATLPNDNQPTTVTLPESNIISSLTCPLSGKILKFPVVASDGYTYEKENILKYFETHDHSPVTKKLFNNKALHPNFTIEGILKTFALHSISSSVLPSSSTMIYYKVQTGDTLLEIAEQKGFKLDQMKAANPELKDFDHLLPNQVIKLPVIQQLIDSTLEKESPVSDDSVTVFQHFTESHSEPSLIPESAPNQNLSDARQKFQALFITYDADADGFMTSEDFATFLSRLNVKLDEQEVVALFRDINPIQGDKLTFQEFYGYFEQMVKAEKSIHTQSELDLLTALLKADSQGKCEMGGVSQFINKRWEKFNKFKRDGRTGKLVMIGGDEAQDILPGEYSLIDLITWSDIVPQDPPLRIVKIPNVRWTESSEPKSKSGRLLFPKNFFDVRLPIERGTNDNLAYYGCCLANESRLKVSLLHRHAIQDFTYLEDYYQEYVKGRAGLERHAFAHLDCPFEEDSGCFILGKFSEENENELHLTAFKIPAKHTLYVPPLTIHSNDYLKGKWRTMLSDATQIDHVILARERHGGGTDQISFDFME